MANPPMPTRSRRAGRYRSLSTTEANPLRTLIHDPDPDDDGMVSVPDGRGLGIDVEIDQLGEFATDHRVLD